MHRLTRRNGLNVATVKCRSSYPGLSRSGKNAPSPGEGECDFRTLLTRAFPGATLGKESVVCSKESLNVAGVLPLKQHTLSLPGSCLV